LTAHLFLVDYTFRQMIFFDIDGTLIDHASASAAARLSFFDHFHGAVPFTREEFPTRYEEILNKHFDRFWRGEISIWQQRRERVREIFAAPGMSDAEADSRYQVFIRDYESRTRAFEDAAPCLHRLAGKSLGVISNGAREQQIGKLRRAGLLGHFSVTVFSEDVGLGKPAQSIFLEACRRAGQRPQNCSHIGDNVDADVIPSRALGMRGICLDRSGTLAVESPVITALTELEKALSC
jgi:putative hydrolase of the HAD superfamily